MSLFEPGSILNPSPLLNHRFGVFFLVGGIIPNPIDIRFQKVSGLSTEITTETINEGGQNLFSHRIPKKISYNNLVLERGMLIGSPVNLEFNITFSTFKFYPCNVIVTLFNENSIPMAAWFFYKAYPVKWAMSNLEAKSNEVMIDTMELAYQRYQLIKL